MSLSQDLLAHAADLLAPRYNDGHSPSLVNIRRSISASYYALFHQLNEDAVALIAPNVPQAVNHRIQRWFDHAEMKQICGRFSKQELDQPLRGLIGATASDKLRSVTSSFVQLQNARHSADYDLSYQVDVSQAHLELGLAALAIQAWKDLQGTAEANIFILSLLLWKNWERERL